MKNEIVNNFVAENIGYYNSFIHNIIFSIWVYLPILYIIFRLFDTNIFSHLLLLLVTYFYDNIVFMIGHMHLHNSFLIYNDPISAKANMNQFIYIAYLHHYFNPYILSMMPKEFLLIYLSSITSNNQNNFVLTNKFIISFFLYILLVIYLIQFCNVFQFYLLSLFNVYILDYIGLGRVSSWYLLWFVFYLCSSNTDMSFLFVSYVVFNTLLQGLSHNWYHTHKKQKYKYYGFFLYHLCYLMETIGIFEIEKHHVHHRHKIHNIEETEQFEDMVMPQFIVSLFDYIWKCVNNKPYFSKIFTILYILHLIFYSITIYYICCII